MVTEHFRPPLRRAMRAASDMLNTSEQEASSTAWHPAYRRTTDVGLYAIKLARNECVRE